VYLVNFSSNQAYNRQFEGTTAPGAMSANHQPSVSEVRFLAQEILRTTEAARHDAFTGQRDLAAAVLALV
jgi:hypothetical protein